MEYHQQKEEFKNMKNLIFFLCGAVLLLSGITSYLTVDVYAYGGPNITRITRVSINKANGRINVYTIGRPYYKSYLFKKDKKNFFILAFARSILYGSGKKISRPFNNIFSISYSQFSASPNYSVHIVLRQNAKAKLLISKTNLGSGHYKITIYDASVNNSKIKNIKTFPLPAKHYSTNFNVFIDAGHGGGDPGGIGPMGLPEDFVNLSIALKLKKLLESKGIRAEIDRTSNINVSLQQRAEEANRDRANLFIGLYCNSVVVPYLYGTTTYYFHGNSYSFANYLEHYISAKLNLKYDGVVKDDLYVLRFTTMPAVVIEYAFISNPYEEHLLGSSTFRQLIADGIANSIYKYFIKNKR